MPKTTKTTRRTAKANKAVVERKTGAASGIERAIAALSAPGAGLSRYEVQKKCGLTRLFSLWDMNRLAERTDRKLELLGVDAYGAQRYRLAAKKAAKGKAAKKAA